MLRIRRSRALHPLRAPSLKHMHTGLPTLTRNDAAQTFGLPSNPGDVPYKRVPVKDILKDITFKGVISDWQPFKAQIEKYTNGDVIIPCPRPPSSRPRSNQEPPHRFLPSYVILQSKATMAGEFWGK